MGYTQASWYAAVVIWFGLCCSPGWSQTLRVGAFVVDATPPIGAALCNGNVKPAVEIVSPLTARGVVITGAGEPLVLCAFDWVGIANESQDAFRAAMAQAAGSSSQRVTVHTLHQHDAPGSDSATERLLAEHGLGGLYSNPAFDRAVLERLTVAVRQSVEQAQPFTHIGLGQGLVEQVASNRRILGPEGRVILQRQSAGGKNPAARQAPEGTIDPYVRLISFWNGEVPLVALTYYATHPQSYYGQGSVNWDFVGMARQMLVEQLGQQLGPVACVHFNGASGNVAAGKYNDGSPENRERLAQRLVRGMQLAWESQVKQAITVADIGWHMQPVQLPLRDTLRETELLLKLADPQGKQAERIRAARDLIFVSRSRAGQAIQLSCLELGSARVLHMPGELFVEYQLAAQAMAPDQFVAMAAYGDYGPGYIGTEIAYSQGGYETGIVSRVAPQVEQVLLDGMQRLLDAAQ